MFGKWLTLAQSAIGSSRTPFTNASYPLRSLRSAEKTLAFMGTNNDDWGTVWVLPNNHAHVTQLIMEE